MGTQADNLLNGLITFFSSHYALKAESVLQTGKIGCRLIPGPKELSPNCGVALQFPLQARPQVEQLLSAKKILFESIFEYVVKAS